MNLRSTEKRVPRRRIVSVTTLSGYRGFLKTMYVLECSHTVTLRSLKFGRHPKTTFCVTCAQLTRKQKHAV